MKKLISLIIILSMLTGVHAQQFPSNIPSKTLTYKLIPSAGKTWGYDIYNKGKLLIHQPAMPALPGNAGFALKSSAKKVAKKVMEKIARGEIPPVVSIAEMKQWGVMPQIKS